MSFRPPSRSNRPVSGIRSSNRPSTGYRRLDTANGQKPIGSRTVGLDTNVQIENRPITQHGMSGMKTSLKGPNRKIADRNYYENKLKEKLIFIVKETETIKEKIRNYNSDKIEISKLQKQRNKLMSEVREYEGKLADYNLALDKMRSGADIINLQEITKEIQHKNEQEKMRVDVIFLERKNLESQINEIENNILVIHNEMINEMSEGDRDKFNSLYNEYERMGYLISEKEKRLHDIQYKYHEIRENLSSNEYSHHLKAIELEKELNQLNKYKIELQQERNGCISMDPQQIKQQILDKVKNDNKVLQQSMEAINSTEDKIEELQNILSEKETDLNAMKEFTKQSHKYEQLFERDAKMQIFIDKFDANVENIQNEIVEVQDDNNGLILHMSENEENKENDMNNKMNDDISLKKQEKNEAHTLIYDQNELKKRKIELEKINKLDTKISIELENMDKKRNEYENDIKAFKTHEEIQHEYKQRKQELFKIKMEIQQNKELTEKNVLEIAQKSDKINRKLNENAYHNQLKEMETKISKLSQNIFSVQDSINQYKREGEYQTIENQVIKMQQEINSALLKELAMQS